MRRIFSVSPQSRSLFSASLQTFCLTARAYLNTQKYGLFCSLTTAQPCTCRNVSHCQQQQSYSGLRSPGRSNSIYFWLKWLIYQEEESLQIKPFSWGLLATCYTCLDYFPSHIFSLNLFFNYIFCFPVSSLNQFIWSKLWLLSSESCWIGFINWTKLNWISTAVMRIYNGNDQPYTFQNPEVQNLRQSSAFDFSLSQDFVDCKTVRIFAYSSTREQSNKRPYGRVRLARFARVRLLRHALPISLLILRKNRLFCSLKTLYRQRHSWAFNSCLRG